MAPKLLDQTRPTGTVSVIYTSSAGAQRITPEFELKTAAREAEFTCGARDVATVSAQRFRNHLPFEFFDGMVER